jgi:O-antigen ligase
MKHERLTEWAACGCRWAVLATIVAAPTQWDIFRSHGGHLTIVEPLMLLAMLCWIVRVFAQGDWWRISFPLPWQVALFVLAALLSIFMAEREGVSDALRETAKVLEYFVVGYVLYDDLLRPQPQRLRTIIYLVLGTMVVIVVIALAQFFVCSDPIRGVTGTFKSRNVLGGWLSMMLPIVFGVALYTTRPWLRAGLWLLVFCGLTVDLSAASLGAVLVVMLLLAATRGWRTFAIAALAATCWVGVMTNHIGWFKDPDTGARQTSQQVLFRSVALYSPDDGQPERRYPQWQSAVEMMLGSPWLGEGIGNYQRRVEQYTGAKPLPTGPSEPDIQNLYLVIGSTMGLPALFAFLALLLTPAFLAGAAAPRHDHWRKGFVYGVAGGIAAFAITAIWHPLLVRGIGLHLVLLLVVARLLSEWPADHLTEEASLADETTPHIGEPSGSSHHHHHHRHHRHWRSPGHLPDGSLGDSDRK